MKLPWTNIHFCGIGGVGMSGLAHICHQAGLNVTGSDITRNNSITELQKNNIPIFIPQTENIPPKTQLLVYSSAVSPNNPEFQSALAQNIPTMRRGEFLAHIAQTYDYTIAVGGSHGKTTVSSILAHIFTELGENPGYMIGGSPAGTLKKAELGKGKIFITEADESDTSLTHLHADTAILVNIEDDHSWSAGGFNGLKKAFATFAQQAQETICGDSSLAREILSDIPEVTYGDIDTHHAPTPLPGRFNKFNAWIAKQAALSYGLKDQDIDTALQNFAGVKRRCSTIQKGDNYLLIEDYAHHPTELREFNAAMNEAYPNHKKIFIFQPHRYERVEKYGEEFAQILKTQKTYITPPFSAWSERNDTPELTPLLQHNAILLEGDWQQQSEQILIAEQLETPTLYAVIGAATIEKIIPYLKTKLLEIDLKKQFPDAKISTKPSWLELSTLGIGDTNPLTAEPQTLEELQKILAYTSRYNIPTLPLGCGSNMVGPTGPYQGLVIRLKAGEFEKFEQKDKQVLVGAGLRLSRLVNKLAKLNLGGGEALIAIPGAVGGSIRMNAGAQGIEICEYLEEIYGLTPDGQVWTKKASDINWHYRGSDIPKDIIITQALMNFKTVDGEKALEDIKKTRDFRKSTQPGGRNPGCAFRNPAGDAAGRLIDKYQLKNFRIDHCSISDIHANFIINEGGGSEEEFAQMLEHIQKTIFEKTGIILKNEVIFSSNRQIKAVNPMNITVLKGGPSTERDISITSAEAVAQALRNGGHTVTEIDVTDFSLPEIPQDTQLIFPVLHGIFGEDGQVQQLIENLNIPYVGCGVQCSQLAINKYETSEFLREKGIDTPKSIRTQSPLTQLPEELTLPVIVKPNSLGSTIGMTLVKDIAELEEATQKALETDSVAIVEEFIQGQEVTVGVLYEKSLPVVEIIPPGEYFDFDAKYVYSKGKTLYNCPPLHIPEDIQQKMHYIAENTFNAINARDLSRVDMIWQKEQNRIVVLEVNTMPGFTASSLLPKAAVQTGISFTELCCTLAVNALKRTETT